MTRLTLIRYAAASGIMLGCAAVAGAQARPAAPAGRCSNPQINAAFTAMTMAPNGAGNAGECNPNNYGAGSWTSPQDLSVRVVHARDCADPWIGQIVWYTSRPTRRATAAECDVRHYNGGHWNSYMDLAGLVATFQNARSLPVNGLIVDSYRNAIDNQGNIVLRGGAWLISQDGGSFVGNNGSAFISHNGSALIEPQPAMVISNDGGSLTSQRALMDVGGKRVVVGKIVRR
jgi:hypothetical protein